MVDEKKYSLEKPRGHEIGRAAVSYSAREDGNYNSKRGLKFSDYFVPKDKNPFDYDITTKEKIEWESREGVVTDDQGNVIFKQKNVDVPKKWSQHATNVVASKYLYGDATVDGDREYSVGSLVDRVTRTITDWGVDGGYFASKEDADNFYKDLTSLCINQHVAFNSPVWFNFGLYHHYGVGKSSGEGNFYFDLKDEQVKQAKTQYEKPQGSACFIQHVDDTMEDIMELARSEAMLFKFGSGSGTDLSTIRSTRDKLTGGGKPSGPLSFLEVYDRIAAVIKSGGKTRRAAKMNTLKMWHPDIKEFIEAKAKEEKKAWALIDAGYPADYNGEVYSSIKFQNENLSVRVTDEFLQAVLEDKEWRTHLVTDPSKEGPIYKARELAKGIAEGAWLCGDPGIQYEDTIQKWHTTKNDGRINSSNPCSEYMFLDDTACNLASLNLVRFMENDGVFNVDKFRKAVDIFITAQEIIVDNASYPTRDIARNSHLYRTLGLGYANLGGLLMRSGLAYDSESGRQTAKAITALMHNEANLQSARLAKVLGAYERWGHNKEPHLEVLDLHNQATSEIVDDFLPENFKGVSSAAKAVGLEARLLATESGVKNAQVTVLAPTGTIGFMMDCDTTGIEPDIALVKYKLLAGGGMMKIVNQAVPSALKKLGYEDSTIQSIVNYVNEKDTIEGAPGLREEHLSVFDCAFKPKNGERFIPYKAHMKMMAAAQPHLSGAISKTVNMPNHATPEEIMESYFEGWRLGLKALAVYRDGCKRSQPVSTGLSQDKKDKYAILVREGKEPGLRALEEKDIGRLEKSLEDIGITLPPRRKKMPATAYTIKHKFEIADIPTEFDGKTVHGKVATHDVYLQVGLYDDGKPGELWITAGQEGSTAGGAFDSFATMVSVALQYGVPLSDLVKKFKNNSFSPSGMIISQKVRGELDKLGPETPHFAKSVPDYIFKWLENNFIEDGKTVPYFTFRKKEDSSQPVEQKKSPSEGLDFLQLSKEDLLKKANTICTGGVCGCGGPAIKTGKCSWFCISKKIPVEGTCAE